MPTYRNNHEAVSKLTAERYRETQSDRALPSATNPGTTGSLVSASTFPASRSSHASTSSTAKRDGRVSRKARAPAKARSELHAFEVVLCPLRTPFLGRRESGMQAAVLTSLYQSVGFFRSLLHYPGESFLSMAE
jgi:hypothetical protein